MPKLTAARLRELLEYDPGTGVFRWLRVYRNAYHGRRAGELSKGYRRIKIDGKFHAEHRLAWLYFYGKWPTKNIDHVNRNSSDNRIVNLREATKSQNAANTSLTDRLSKSGLKGAYRRTNGAAWKAAITVNYKQIHLGSFQTKEEAHAAYCVAAKQLFGEFA